MKLPGVNWEKVASSGRSVWSATAGAGGKVGGALGAMAKSRRAVVTAAALGVGALTSTAGYLALQGKPSGDSTAQTATADGAADGAAPSDDGSTPPVLQPIPADGDGQTSDPAPGAALNPLRPPPASAFQGGQFGAAPAELDPGRSPAEGELPVEGAPPAEGDAALDSAPAPVEEGVPQEGAPADPNSELAAVEPGQGDAGMAPEPPGRPRILGVDDSAVQPTGADDANTAPPADAAMAADAGAAPAELDTNAGSPDPAATTPGAAADSAPPAATVENGVPADSAAGAPAAPSSGAPGEPPAGLRPVPRADVQPVAPAEPPPPPDRITIPSDPPEPTRQEQFGAASPLASPGARLRGSSGAGSSGMSLAPGAAALGAGAGAAAGLAAEGAGALGSTGAAAGAGLGGAVGGAGLARLGGASADDGPSIARPTPGPKELEGAQTPSLALEKFAPPEIQVGKPAVFEIKVRNVGRTTAHGVVVTDQVPVGTRLIDAEPEAERGEDGAVRWRLGALAPGQEASLLMRLLPEQEGEIGSVAQVTFQSQASVRTVCTRPQIALQHQLPAKVQIGDDVPLVITVANNGTGAATGLVIEESVPEGLEHEVDRELEYPIGVLRPGESRRVELKLKATKPGTIENLLVIRSDDQPVAEDRQRIEVVAPQLKVGLTGPKVRYLDRQATYSVAVSNPGTSAAKNVELAAYLPRGLKFVAAENQGQYDERAHAVFWGLAELPVGATGAAQLTVLPIEPGQQAIRVTGQGDLGVQDELQQAVTVETLSELQFSIADVADPIEVGSDTTYDIRVTNRGSRAATNVQVVVGFPPELQPISGEGPSRVSVRGAELVVDPIARLNPDTEARYLLRVRGLRAGDPRIRVQVLSAESPNPVTKEESTRVYADE